MRVPPGSIAIACLVGMAACAQSEIAIPDLISVAPADPPWVAEEIQPRPAIEAFLSTLDDLQWQKIRTERSGYDAYLLLVNQPVDHEQLEGERFQQRVILHHRSEQAPMVLYTSGYSLFVADYQAELSGAMGANQINVEQRFFGSSKPSAPQVSDWEHLNIEQAANDHHRIVELLSTYYTGSWISTGHSKGGMTSVYHRRFFPNDVDATVAYVAPISFGTPDDSYQAHVAGLGSEECRTILRDAQLRALDHFPSLLSMAQSYAADRDLQFDRAGGQASAFEAAIAAMEWSFWQGRGDPACNVIPSPEATDQLLFDFVRKTVGVGADDASLAMVDAYYYQASAQLGYPSISLEHIDGLLLHQDGPSDYYPLGSPAPDYDASAMLDIESWLHSQNAARILFVYGEQDPWTGGAFDTGSCQECPSFTAPGSSHNALLADLAGPDQQAAAAAIERWTGVRPAIGSVAGAKIERPTRPTLLPPRNILGLSASP